MAFNPDAYLKSKSGGPSGFNPDSYLSKNGIKSAPQSKEDDSPESSKVTAVAAGLANPIGFADEMSALGSTAMNAITGMSGPLDGKGGTVQDLVDEYHQKRDEMRGILDKIQKSNPKTYMAARLASGVATGGMGAAPETLGQAVGQGVALGGAGGLGESNADLTNGEYKKAAIDTAKGAAFGGGAGAIGYGIGKTISSLANGEAAKALKSSAEKNAVKATGATGKQISNFDDNAGRELLDRGIVKFGDAPKNIAKKADKAVSDAEQGIESTLKSLDEKGVTVNTEDVIGNLNAKIAELKKDPSQADIVRKLQTMVDDIKSTGEPNPLISAAENTKRGYNRMAKNWQDPEKGQAGKAAYRAYRDAVEQAAESSDPAISQTFKDAKKTYGLMSPIQEAAERRASTLQQSPLGGLGDISAAGAGALKGGLVGAALAPVARRIISPRMASSIAVTEDAIANALQKMPDAFGKYAPMLQEAANRGAKAFAETNALLKKDPKYLEIIGQFASKNDDVKTPIADMRPPQQTEAVSANTKDVSRDPSSIKGEALWMNNGAKNLDLSQDQIDKLQNSKAGRSLLIEASDLPKDSKRLKAIQMKISRGDFK